MKQSKHSKSPVYFVSDDAPRDVISNPGALIAKYEHRTPATFAECLEAAVALVESVFGKAPGFVPFVRTVNASGMRHFDINPTVDFYQVLPLLIRDTRACIVTVATSHIVATADLPLADELPDRTVGFATVDCFDRHGRHETAQTIVDIRNRVARRADGWVHVDRSRRDRGANDDELRPARLALNYVGGHRETIP